jgi:hypothetical protein
MQSALKCEQFVTSLLLQYYDYNFESVCLPHIVIMILNLFAIILWLILHLSRKEEIPVWLWQALHILVSSCSNTVGV